MSAEDLRVLFKIWFQQRVTAQGAAVNLTLDLGWNPRWEEKRNTEQNQIKASKTPKSLDTFCLRPAPCYLEPWPRRHTSPRKTQTSKCGSLFGLRNPRVGARKGDGRESWAQHFELITAASSHGFSGEKYSLAIISSLIIRHSLVPNKLNSFTLRQSPRNQTNHLSQQDAAFKN